MREKLSAPGLRDRLYVIELGKYKDASGLYLSDREGFQENLNRALAAAMPLAELERREAAKRPGRRGPSVRSWPMSRTSLTVSRGISHVLESPESRGWRSSSTWPLPVDSCSGR